MSISQESLLLISMPNSAITVSQMHIPSITHFQKAVGWVRPEFFCYLIYGNFFSDLGSRGRKIINKKALKMTS